jgi:cytidylate kinase
LTFVVSIDGPAAAGKGTIGRSLATHFNFSYLDTGLLYRAVASKALMTGRDPIEIATQLSEKDLYQSNLRNLKVAKEASLIAIVPEVRIALKIFQEEFSQKGNGAILDGRDIGTVICPNADIKFFILANSTVRAKRRFDELQKSNHSTTFEVVLSEILARDKMDADRTHSPMIKPKDAFVIDTSVLSIIDAINTAKSLVQRVILEKN